MANVAATLATRQPNGDIVVYSGGSSDNDNEILLTLDASGLSEIIFGHGGTGAVDVFASLDGTTFLTTALSLEDLGDTTAGMTDYVNVTANNRVYRIKGPYRALRFMQNGANAVTGFALNGRR